MVSPNKNALRLPITTCSPGSHSLAFAGGVTRGA